MRHLNESPDWWPSVVGLDIETQASDYPDPFNYKIAVVQVGTPDGNSYIFTEMFERLVPMLENPSIMKVIHNANFDMRYLQHQLSCLVRNVWDSFLMERILTAGTGLGCGLGDAVWRRAEKLIEKDSNIRKSFIPGQPLTDRQLRYVEDDVLYLYAVHKAQEAQIGEDGLTKIANLEHALLPIVVAMELTGICVDEGAWVRFRDEEVRMANTSAKEMCNCLDMPAYTPNLFGEFVSPINLNSWQQVLGVLTRSGIDVDSTQADVLEGYLEEHPECAGVRAYLEYKSHMKAVSWDYPKHINPKTGRVHTSYKQVGADTGRFSSVRPNLQNVPRDNRVRQIFVPAEGYLFISADYGQQEMRIMAEMSGDEHLRDVCRHEDPHLANARMIWGRPDMKELKGEERDTIKGTGFCMNYGGGGKTFAQSAGIPEAEGHRILSGLKASYAGVFSWGESQRRFARKQGYVETIWKRRRYFPGIDTDPNLYPNEPLNTPIQGTAADMIKRAMVRLGPALSGMDARILLQIHDELIIEVEENSAEDVAIVVETEMAAAGADMVSSVPCPADARVLECWQK